MNAPIAGTFVTDGTRPGDRRLSAGRQDVDAVRAGHRRSAIKSGLVRLTYQVSPKNKLAAYFDEIDKFRGHAMFAGDDYNTAAVVWNSPAYHTAVGEVDVDGEQSPAARRRLLEQHRGLHERVAPGRQQSRAAPQAWYAGAARRDLDLVSTSVQPLISNINTHEPAPLQPAGVGVVRHRLAQHEGRLAADVRPLRPHLRRQRRPRSAVSQQRSTGIPFTGPQQRRRLQHAGRVARGTRLRHGHLRPGSVDVSSA